MAKLKVLQKGDGLFHTDISIYLEAYVSNRSPWIHVSYDILGDNIQSWLLFATKLGNSLFREMSRMMMRMDQKM